MNSYRYFYFPLVMIVISMLVHSQAKEGLSTPQNRVMSVDEFKQAINNNKFLKSKKQTVDGQSFDQHEIEMIEEALKQENIDYGGEFDSGREINTFTGSTLFVGGGKKSGACGENDGKTVLIDYLSDVKEIEELIEKLHSGKWIKDPYTGKEFKTDDEKGVYIKALEHKKALYKEAFAQKNEDTLNTYYTLNIDKNVQPDMVGSITSEFDMSKIPAKKFRVVEFENVPCHVFINPKLYPILERITKPGGTIKFSISNVCRRLIVPIIQATKFGNEFTHIMEKDYHRLEEMDATYGSHNIILTNKTM